MEFLYIAIIAIVTSIILILIGIPIAFAIGACTVGAILIGIGAGPLARLGILPYSSFFSMSWIPLPLFMLMACIIGETAIGEDIFNAANKWLSFVPGGLLVASVAGEALMAATAPHLQRLFAEKTTPDCSAVQRFYYNPNQYTEYYDLQNMMYHLLSDEEYAAWLPTFQAAVPLSRLSPTWYSMYETGGSHVYQVKEPDYTGGISVFVPSNSFAQRGYVKAYHAYDWYKDAGLSNTGW